MQKAKTKAKKKKSNLVITSKGRAYVTCTYNNTLITITNDKGDVVAWTNPGAVGFTGARRSTPYAASLAAESAAKKALEKGVNTVEIITKGPGSAKISAIKSLKTAGLKIVSIKDVTPLPHNGCRAKKKRRV
ncbi:MAG TPA: 30S ribosomal protein S11 [candidate division WWE3 bacterium]|uniref:Small ribosomal subunit protein uS11 n=1 Tax=candidate division WWE3 bacterium TaxID=2053526 RepID=A0A7V5J184_UNCKA|nr:30S ribosomal protein S11 [candidate division WWE3 bacterium]